MYRYVYQSETLNPSRQVRADGSVRLRAVVRLFPDAEKVTPLSFPALLSWFLVLQPSCNHLFWPCIHLFRPYMGWAAPANRVERAPARGRAPLSRRGEGHHPPLTTFLSCWHFLC